MIFTNSFQQLSFVLSNQNTHIFDFHKHEPFISNWVSILFIAILIIIAVLRTLFGKYLRSLLQSLFNNQTASRMQRECSSSNRIPIILLNWLFYITTAIYIYHIPNQIFASTVSSGWKQYLIALALIIVFVNTKRLLYLLAGYIFQSNTQTNEYLYHKSSGNHIAGICLLIPALSMFFSSNLLLNILLFGGAIIITIISIISSLRGGIIIFKKGFPVFYLILYLCTLEILPLLIVWKILW